MGANRHHYILERIDDLRGSIIEIGSGGASTDFYAALAACLDRFTFYAVDPNHRAYEYAKRLAKMIPRMTAYNLTGERFFSEEYPKISSPICFAYLDNHDWNYDELTAGQEQPWIASQRSEYELMGIEYSNKASAQAHLDQTKEIIRYAADRCVILFDDTYDTGRTMGLQGKGMTAVPYLLENGWKIVDQTNLSIALSNY